MTSSHNYEFLATRLPQSLYNTRETFVGQFHANVTTDVYCDSLEYNYDMNILANVRQSLSTCITTMEVPVYA